MFSNFTDVYHLFNSTDVQTLTQQISHQSFLALAHHESVNAIKDIYRLTLSAEFTVNLHVTGCSGVSGITGVNPRINNVALQDLKKPFPSHCINAQVFARLHLSPVLERIDQTL